MTWTRTEGNTHVSVVELPPGYPLKVSARTQAGCLPFFPVFFPANSLSSGILQRAQFNFILLLSIYFFIIITVFGKSTRQNGPLVLIRVSRTACKTLEQKYALTDRAIAREVDESLHPKLPLFWSTMREHRAQKTACQPDGQTNTVLHTVSSTVHYGTRMLSVI